VSTPPRPRVRGGGGGGGGGPERARGGRTLFDHLDAMLRGSTLCDPVEIFQDENENDEDQVPALPSQTSFKKPALPEAGSFRRTDSGGSASSVASNRSLSVAQLIKRTKTYEQQERESVGGGDPVCPRPRTHAALCAAPVADVRRRGSRSRPRCCWWRCGSRSRSWRARWRPRDASDRTLRTTATCSLRRYCPRACPRACPRGRALIVARTGQVKVLKERIRTLEPLAMGGVRVPSSRRNVSMSSIGDASVEVGGDLLYEKEPLPQVLCPCAPHPRGGPGEPRAPRRRRARSRP